MADPVRPESVRADGGAGRTVDDAGCRGLPTSGAGTRHDPAPHGAPGQGNGTARQGPDPDRDQDPTGPGTAAGFGAWRAAVAEGRDGPAPDTADRRALPPGSAVPIASSPGSAAPGPIPLHPPSAGQFPPGPPGRAGIPPARPAAGTPAPVPDLPGAPTQGTWQTPPSAGLAALDLLDTLAEVVFRTDAEGRWTYLNPAWTRLTGFDIARSLGSRFIDYVHPDELEHTIALFMAVVVGGADHCHHETRYRTADGTYRRVQIRAKVLRDETGEVVGNVGTIIDVTEARFGAEMASEQGALLELVPTGGKIDDLPVGVVIYDPDDTVRRASRVVDRLVGARTRVGDPLDTLAARLRPSVSVKAGPTLGGQWGLVATARRTEQAQIGDLDVVASRPGTALAAGRPVDGEPPAPLEPWRSLRATVIPIKNDGAVRVAVTLSDITDLRRAERQQAALAYLGQRALTLLDVPALLNEAVELVASTLVVDRCDLIECVEVAPQRDQPVPAESPAGEARGVVVTRAAPDDGDRRAAATAGGGRWGREDGGRDAHPGGGGAGGGEVYAHVRACHGRRGGSWAAGAVSAAPGFYVWNVLSSREPLVIDDLAARSDVRPEGWLQGDGTRATVGAPIGVGSRAFGILAAHSYSHRRFTRDEAHFVQSVANVVAATVELAQMQEDRARLAVFEDRDRIACELHDLVIQRLFSVGLRLQSLVRLVAEPGTTRMATAISDLDQTIDEVRRTIFDLRPPYA